MKRRALALFIVLLAFFLTACKPLVPVESIKEPLDVYATFYPVHALTDALTQDLAEVRLNCLVQPQDGCLRDYGLSDWDIYLLAYEADAIVLAGNGLENFERSLYSFGDSGPALITAAHGLSLYNENDRVETDEETSHLRGPNPHVYMSVAGAKEMLVNIANGLCNLVPSCENAIGTALQTAQTRLDGLLTEMTETTANCRGKSVVLMNEALVYTAEELGLDIAYIYDRESGSALYENELINCLAVLEGTGAKVVLVEKQAPDMLVNGLKEAGYSVARIDIFSTGRPEMGFDGYLTAQSSNARAIADAFADMEEVS